MSELLVEKQQGVPEGYKLTEVGVIPEDWLLWQLNELCSFENGDRSSNYPSSGSFVEGGIPFINAGHVNEGVVSSKDMNYISSKVFKRLGGGKVKPKDILFCLRGSLGKFGVIPSKFGKGAIASSLVIIRPNKRKILLKYLVAGYFKSKTCQEMIELWAGGAAQPNLGARELGKFLVPLPQSKTEQTAIATALSDVDELLSSLEALIAKKQAIKTATMQQLLSGCTRLPQFAFREDGSLKGYKPSELGEIPEDWEVKSYEEIFTYLSTSTNSRADLSSIGDYGYVHYGDIHTKWNNKLDLNQVELPQVSKELVSSAFIEDGDVIMADASEDYEGVGKSVEVSNIGDRKAVAGLHTFLLRDREKKLSDGFRGYLHTIPIVKASLDKMATGLKVYGISKRNLALILIPTPSKQEQTAIATILFDMDAEIEGLEKQLNKTQQIKQGMMQQLLTGKIRLVKPN